jgi:hypothetical protein
MVAVKGSFQEKSASFLTAEPSGRATTVQTFDKMRLDGIVIIHKIRAFAAKIILVSVMNVIPPLHLARDS